MRANIGLYRGKTYDNVWIEGNLIIENQICHIYANGEKYKIIPESIGEYTGQTDKNENKIFEGDIVKIKTGLMLNGKHAYCRIGKVVYTQCCYFVFLGTDDNRRMRLYRENDDETCEIIGNIYDNPELSKGGTEK